MKSKRQNKVLKFWLRYMNFLLVLLYQPMNLFFDKKHIDVNNLKKVVTHFCLGGNWTHDRYATTPPKLVIRCVQQQQVHTVFKCLGQFKVFLLLLLLMFGLLTGRAMWRIVFNHQRHRRHRTRPCQCLKDHPQWSWKMDVGTWCRRRG